MIQDICDGAVPAFAVFALFSTGVLSKLAWAAMFAAFATSEGADRSYGWLGVNGAIAVCITAEAISDWVKVRRARKRASDV